MRFRLTAAQESWVAEIRAFLAEHVTDGLLGEIHEHGDRKSVV